MPLFLGWEIGRGRGGIPPKKTKKTKKPLHGNICTPASPRARFLCAGLSRMLWTYHLALELPNGIFPKGCTYHPISFRFCFIFLHRDTH